MLNIQMCRCRDKRACSKPNAVHHVAPVQAVCKKATKSGQVCLTSQGRAAPLPCLYTDITSAIECRRDIAVTDHAIEQSRQRRRNYTLRS